MKLYFRYRHDTNDRFAEGKKYEVIADLPQLECCLVKIENDEYRKADIIYYHQGTIFEE